MLAGRYDLRVRVSPFDPYERSSEAFIQKRGDLWCYRVFLFLEGHHLPWVDHVVYHLHPSFDPPDSKVPRTIANPSCRLETWAWSEFPMITDIHLKSGDVLAVSHEFDFTTELRMQPRALQQLPETMGTRL